MNDGLNNNNDLNNLEQNDYYNNDSYYSNNNYDNNYSDTTYEEKEKKSGIWWKILLVILVILIIIFLLLRFCGTGGGKSKDEKYAALTTKICKAAESYVMNNPSVLDRTEPGRTAIIKFKTLADANLIEPQIENPYYDGGLFKNGTVEKYYSMDSSVRLTVANDGTLGCELVDNSKDVTAPELRLNGDVEITLAIGTNFEDPGYTATDDYDGDITDKVVTSGNVDNSKAGKYELTYTVQDSAGNVTTKKRTIIYEEYADIDITLGSILDGVTPQISLKGANPYCMVKGTKYVEPGATATDNVDGNITNRIAVTGNVTGNLMGSFRMVYKVEDSSGNQAIAYRAVIVTTECPNENKPENVANNKPTITLIGKNAVTINRGTEYIDLGATAYDKEDGDITRKIVTDASQVNIYQTGVYKVIYRVTDSAGVTVTATRTVTVKDAVAGNPSVRFTEDKKNITVIVGEGDNTLITPPKAVNENGVQVVVTSYIEDYATKAQVSAIDWTKAGKYRVIYTAIHGNGSVKQTKTIVVTINNGTVTIGGKDAINVNLRTDSCDITEADLVKGGVTFTSTGLSTPIVTLSGHEQKACKLGTYEITVSAKVDNGEPTTKKITVYVVNGEAEAITKDSPSKVRITGNSANPGNVYNTNNVWVGGTVTGITVTFEATPAANTEIAHFEWSSDCAKVGGKVSKISPTTGTMTWTNAGNASVCVRAVTTANVVGPWSDPVKLLIDRTGPEVRFTHTWQDKKEDWHNTSLTVEYNATDSESGLSHFEYTYDDVKAKKAEEIVTYDEATGKLIVNEDTEPTRKELFVYVRAVDKAGNKGPWTTNPAYTNIDTVKPEAPVLEVVGNNTKIVKINTTFKDGESVRPSGFGKLIYTIDEGEEKTELVSTITMPVNNTNENKASFVKVWAVDKAGNRSDNYSTTNVIVAPGKKATGVELTNDGKKIEAGASCSTTEVNPGGTFKLVANPVPRDANVTELKWSISDANIATIDEEGNVKAKNVGVTTITAKMDEVTTTCILTVKQKVTSSGSSGGSYNPPSDGGNTSGDKDTDKDSSNMTGSSQYVVRDANGKAVSFHDSYAEAEAAAKTTYTSSGKTGSTVSKVTGTSVNAAGTIIPTKEEKISTVNVSGNTQGATVVVNNHSTNTKTTTTHTSSGTTTTTKNGYNGKTTTTTTTSKGTTTTSSRTNSAGKDCGSAAWCNR